jgi:hypothetical protein
LVDHSAWVVVLVVVSLADRSAWAVVLVVVSLADHSVAAVPVVVLLVDSLSNPPLSMELLSDR